MHIDLIMRFIETQTLILSPICPHICEYIWGTLLGKEKLIVCSDWPKVQPIDEVLLRSFDYLVDATHDFRKRATTFLLAKKVRPKDVTYYCSNIICMMNNYNNIILIEGSGDYID